MDGILTLSRLQDFQLRLSGCWDTSLLLELDGLSQLKKLSIWGDCSNYQPDITSGVARAIKQSPQLTHLEVVPRGYGFDSYKAATVRDLLGKVPPDRPLRLTHLSLHDICIQTPLDDFMLSHLRCLTSLNLSATGSTSVFTALARERVFLSHIVVQDVDDCVLD